VQGGYDGNGLSVLADFLTQKSGYCIHFASAMAVMARLEGIPSRIAVGYAPGRPTGATVAVSGQGPLPEFEVDARDAHAWPELYFQGVGWVAFEPTPSRGVVPAYATDASVPSGASTNDRNDALTPGDGSTQAPVPVPGTVPLPGAGTPAPGGAQTAQALYGVAAVLLLALLVASPRLVRSSVRRRRLRTGARGYPGAAAGTALPAWAELRDLATDYGMAPGASETPRHFSERLRASAALGGPGGADGPGQQAAAALTEDFEREQYGRPGGAAGPAQNADSADPAGPAARIALVQASLRANAGFLVRLRAAWLPSSVMSGWRRALQLPRGILSRTAQRTRRGFAGSWGKIRNSVRRVRRG
jgi:hypothetical protein